MLVRIQYKLKDGEPTVEDVVASSVVEALVDRFEHFTEEELLGLTLFAGKVVP